MDRSSDLPDGFEMLTAGNTAAAVRSSARDRLLGLGIMDEAKFRDACSEGLMIGGGRGGVISLLLDERSGERAVVRHCRRGGALGRLLGDRYLSPSRVLEELRISEAARAAGVPTPECLAAVVRRRGLFCSADLIVREVRPAISLEQWLRQNADAPPGAIRDVSEAVAEAFSKLAAAGVFHPDLHAGNVLIQNVNAVTRACLVDFDRARLLPAPDGAMLGRMLFRFNRALVKRGLAPDPVSLSVRLRFCRLLGIGGDRREMHRFAAECAAHLARHSWRY